MGEGRTRHPAYVPFVYGRLGLLPTSLCQLTAEHRPIWTHQLAATNDGARFRCQHYVDTMKSPISQGVKTRSSTVFP